MTPRWFLVTSYLVASHILWIMSLFLLSVGGHESDRLEIINAKWPKWLQWPQWPQWPYWLSQWMSQWLSQQWLSQWLYYNIVSHFSLSMGGLKLIFGRERLSWDALCPWHTIESLVSCWVIITDTLVKNKVTINYLQWLSYTETTVTMTTLH